MGEVPGTPLSQIVGIYSNVKPEDRECLKTSLSRLVHGETDHDQREARVKDGEGWKWIRLDIMEAGLEKSSPILLLMNYDISELKCDGRTNAEGREIRAFEILLFGKHQP